MCIRYLLSAFSCCISWSITARAMHTSLPPGFVYLKDVDNSIMQSVRYHGNENFLGKPVDGYTADEPFSQFFDFEITLQ